MAMTWLRPLLNIILIFAATLGNENTQSEYRMPGIIRPLTYDVTLRLFSGGDHNVFEGECETYMQIKRPTQYIVMHADELTVEFQHLYSYPHKVEHTKIEQESNNKTQTISFKFDKELIPGPYSIQLKFKGKISKEKRGFFRTTYTDAEGKEQWVLATHLKPTGARRLFPCWDEPASKATFGINIQHPTDFVALSNMPIRQEQDIAGMKLTGFHASPVMSSYLVAIVVGKFVKESSPMDNVNIYILSGQEATDQLKYSLSNVNILTAFAKTYTGNAANGSLMLPKIDHVILPYLPDDTVESWGISLYQQDHMTYNAELDTLQDKGRINILVARKIAYQWMSSIVCPYWWTKMWLNEALTTFLAQKALGEVSKKNGTNDLQFYYALDLQYRSYRTNIYNISEKEDEINTVQEIDGINLRSFYFVKGYAVLRMLEKIMTTNVFDGAIMRYVDQFKFGLATVDEFWDSLQYSLDNSNVPHSEYKIRELMESWIKQKYYPVLSTIRDYRTGRIVITQESVNSEENNGKGNKWLIPIIIDVREKVSGRHIRTTNVYWLRPTESSITIDDVYANETFIIHNVGYYRVNYDWDTWGELIKYLNSANYFVVDELQRAQIIDDAFFFLSNDKLHFSTFVKFIQYLQYEKHFVPWLAMTNYILDHSHYSEFPEGIILKTRLAEIFNTILEDVGYEEKPNEDDNTKFVRLLTTRCSCHLGNTMCREKAVNALEKFIEDPDKLTTELPPWWKKWIFCSGLMSANIDIWRKVLIRYTKTQDKELLIYLTCTEEPKIIISYMNFLYNITESAAETYDFSPVIPSSPQLDDEMYKEIFHSITKRYVNNGLVLDYIIKHFEKIKPKSMSWNIAVADIIDNVYSEAMLDEVSKFVETNQSKDPFRKLHSIVAKQATAIKEAIKVVAQFSTSETQYK